MELFNRNPHVQRTIWTNRDEAAQLAWKLANDNPSWRLARVASALAEAGFVQESGNPYQASGVHHLICIAELIQTRS